MLREGEEQSLHILAMVVVCVCTQHILAMVVVCVCTQHILAMVVVCVCTQHILAMVVVCVCTQHILPCKQYSENTDSLAGLLGRTSYLPAWLV